MANQKNVKLVGMKSRTETAQINAEVVGYISADKKFAVVVNEAPGGDIDIDSITLKTGKGSYVLTKSLTANRYEGKCRNISVHVVLKKISGQVIYWTK
jgi:hypothetical protein